MHFEFSVCHLMLAILTHSEFAMTFELPMAAKNLSLRGEQKLFARFINSYGKTYKDMEEQAKRFSIFRDNLRNIEQMNKEERGTAVYGVTMFSDLTRDEFRQLLTLNMTMFTGNKQRPFPKEEQKNHEVGASPYFSYITHPQYPPAKDQKKCSSCWAFSAVGVLDILYGRAKNNIVPFSEQQVLDCSGAGSCSGGSLYETFEYLESNGLNTAADYPYEGKDKKTCRANRSKAKVSINLWTNMISDESKMLAFIEKAPLAISINSDPMQHYKRGIMDPKKCPGDKLNHSVVVVGYGSAPMDYWEIRNSWGPHWALAGHAKVRRGAGTCGIGSMVLGVESVTYT